MKTTPATKPKMAAIYALCCPTTGTVRYIGKANNAEARLKRHLLDAQRRDTPVYRWIRKLARDGLIPVMRVIEETTDWREAERRHIAAAREIGPLLNVADGGDEPACSSETRSANGRKTAELRRTDPVAHLFWHAKKTLGQARREGRLSEFAKDCMRQLAAKRPDVFGDWATV